MFVALAVILFLAWITGFFVFHITSFAIHILIVLAVITLVVHLFRSRRSTV